MALSDDAHPVAADDPLPRHPAAGALSLKVPLVVARDECTRSRPASGSVVQDRHHAPPAPHCEMRPVSGRSARCDRPRAGRLWRRKDARRLRQSAPRAAARTCPRAERPAAGLLGGGWPAQFANRAHVFGARRGSKRVSRARPGVANPVQVCAGGAAMVDDLKCRRGGRTTGYTSRDQSPGRATGFAPPAPSDRRYEAPDRC